MSVLAGKLLQAGTLPYTTPVPPLCDTNEKDCANNYGHLVIENLAGNPVHEVRVGDFIQVRYTVPPDGDPRRYDRPGRQFFLQSPDLDGAGYDPGTGPGGLVLIDYQNPQNNVLWSDSVDIGPERDATYDPWGIGGWAVYFNGGEPYGPGTVYQKTLRLENIPEHQANRWYFLGFGPGQEWPLAFVQSVRLWCRITLDQEEYELNDLVTAEVEVGIPEQIQAPPVNDVSVLLARLVPSDGLTHFDGPNPVSVPQLARGERRTFTIRYLATRSGPVFLATQAIGVEDDGTKLYSREGTAVAFVGGKGDLLWQERNNYRSFPDDGPPEPPVILGDDSYEIRDPATRFADAARQNPALFSIFVQNDGQANASFLLNVTETTDSDWEATYQFEGSDAGSALLAPGGLLVSDLPPGGTRELRVAFRPGPDAREKDEILARFDLRLAGGNGTPMDAIQLGATVREGELKAILSAKPDLAQSGFYDLELRVINHSSREFLSVQGLIDVGLGGTGAIRYVGQVEPFMLDSLAPGASFTFRRRFERLNPDPIRIDARASSRSLLSNLASTTLDEETDLLVVLETPQERNPLGEAFLLTGVMANRSDQPLELQPFDNPGDLVVAGQGAVEIVKAQLPLLARTLQPGEQFPVTLVLRGVEPGEVQIALRARARLAGGELLTARSSPSSTTVVSRGDFLIKAVREQPAFFAVDDEYQKAPYGAQYRKMPTRAQSSARFDVRVRNDNPSAATFVVRPVPNPTENWAVEYWQGEEEITARFAAPEGFSTGELPPGGALDFQVRVRPLNAAAGPQVFQWWLADAEVPEEATDAVAVEVEVVSLPLAMTMRRMSAGGYTAASVAGGIADPLVPVADPDRLLAQPEVTHGLIADGVTPLVVAMAPDPPEAIEEFAEDETLELELKWAGISGGGINTELISESLSYYPQLFSVLRDGVWEPVSSYTFPPLELSRANPAAFLSLRPIPADALEFDPGSTAIEVKLEAKAGEETLGELVIRIAKPPIALIHGYNTTGDWGGEAIRTFRETRERSLVQVIRYGIGEPPPGPWSPTQTALSRKAGSYLVNTVGTFAELVPVLESALRGKIEPLKQHWAFTRHDVIAHSQGGVMTRILCSQTNYRGAENHYRGRFHRMVTIGSPHNGTRILHYILALEANWNPVLMSFQDFVRRGVASANIYALIAQDKFDPWGSQIASLNTKWPPDPDAPFHFIRTTVNHGQPPDITSRDLSSVFLGLNFPGVGTTVAPLGSDGIVDFDAMAGRTSANSYAIPSDKQISHAYVGTPAGDLFGGEVGQVVSLDVARHAMAVLNQDATGPNAGNIALGPFVPASKLGDGIREQIDVAALNTAIQLVVKLGELNPLSATRRAISGVDRGSGPAIFQLQFGGAEVPPPDANGIYWQVGVYGQEGAALGIDSVVNEDGSFDVAVGPEVVGDVVVNAFYKADTTTLVVAEPRLLGTFVPDGVQPTGIHLFSEELALTEGMRVPLEVFMEYDDGTVLRRYLAREAVTVSVDNPSAVDLADPLLWKIGPGAGTVTVSFAGFQATWPINADPPPPASLWLRMEPGTAADSLRLFWEAADAVLEQTDDLANPAAWIPVDRAFYQTTGRVTSWTTPLTPTPRFFRLRQP